MTNYHTTEEEKHKEIYKIADALKVIQKQSKKMVRKLVRNQISKL